MTTYTWIGVTGPWTAASFWTVNGASNGSFPQVGDDAIIAAAGTYTVTVDTITANNLTVSDPAATLQIGSGSVAIGPIGPPQDISNVLTVASTTNAGTIDIAGNAIMVSGAGTFVNTGTIVIDAGTNTVAGTLEVEGNYSTAGLGTIEINGGLLALKGTLDNIGTVFSASDLAGPTGGVAFENCFIEGGTLDFSTADFPVGGGVLDGVTVLGALACRAGIARRHRRRGPAGGNLSRHGQPRGLRQWRPCRDRASTVRRPSPCNGASPFARDR